MKLDTLTLKVTLQHYLFNWRAPTPFARSDIRLITLMANGDGTHQLIFGILINLKKNQCYSLNKFLIIFSSKSYLKIPTKYSKK